MEKLYHNLWKSKLLRKQLFDTEGNEIEVIDPGLHNHDSGPDFFNSKIKIGGTEWVGNIEIHVKASDWFRHKHDKDPAYDSIILHVVGVSDMIIHRADGSPIPQLELTFPEKFFQNLSSLSSQTDGIKCGELVPQLPPIIKTDWLESLYIERLQEKSLRIKELLELTGNNWEQTCFIVLSRALGFGLNGQPFEMLAKSIPLTYLHHHSDSSLQLQALLFGQAAMLDSSVNIFDEYYQTLCREYYFLARKYNLRPLRPGLWKYSRTRPQNFPHRRIAWLATLCQNGFSLFSRIMDNAGDPEGLKQLFELHLEGYWANRYSFGERHQASASKSLSDSSINSLIINVAVPLIYVYASITGNPEMGEKAVNILSELPPENNSIIRMWKSVGFSPADAEQTQSLIHLKKNYCDNRKCMFCRFGNFLLRKPLVATN